MSIEPPDGSKALRRRGAKVVACPHCRWFPCHSRGLPATSRYVSGSCATRDPWLFLAPQRSEDGFVPLGSERQRSGLRRQTCWVRAHRPDTPAQSRRAASAFALHGSATATRHGAVCTAASEAGRASCRSRATRTDRRRDHRKVADGSWTKATKISTGTTAARPAPSAARRGAPGASADPR